MKLITILKIIKLYELQENSEKWNGTGWKNSYHTSTDVSMLGYGCGVSQYPQFFVKYLDMYHVLPRPYLGYFDGGSEDKLILKHRW